MHILALPNAFKGSLSARQAVRLLTRHLIAQGHQVQASALSDGGDGFIDFFCSLHPKSRLIRTYAKNAFLRTCPTSYLWLPSAKTAVIETARICGLATAQKLDVLGASSYGIGQVLAHALKRGAKIIYIGLGGVACNDGGAGLVQALGAQLLDKKGNPLSLGAQALTQLKKADITALQSTLKGVRIYTVADVKNPLLGPRGSARIFGPQKGATPSQVHLLEKALAVYAHVIRKSTGRDAARTPGTAAAGGICAGLYGLLGAEIIFGADFLNRHLPLDKWAQKADLIITGEGKLDCQTLSGKAPLCALQLAVKYNKPVLFICGQYDPTVLRLLPRSLQLQVACLSDFAPDKTTSMRRAAQYIGRICRSIS